jgi:hypothetical protein
VRTTRTATGELEHLERTDRAPQVVRIDPFGRCRVALGEVRVRAGRVARPADQQLAADRRVGRRERQVVDDRPEVQPGAAHQQRGRTASGDLFDRLTGDPLEGATVSSSSGSSRSTRW